MTVAELIAELQKHPPKRRVCLVYDSAVMVVDIERVVTWNPGYYDEPEEKSVVGLFDQSSVWEIPK
jgi:hypothetical protein